MFRFAIILCCAVLPAWTENPEIYFGKEVWGQCLKESSMTQEDMKRYEDVPLLDAPEEILCLIKCANIKLGVISQNGQIDVEKLSQRPKIVDIEDSLKKEILKCAEGVEKIESCNDVKKFHDCLKKLDKQM